MANTKKVETYGDAPKELLNKGFKKAELEQTKFHSPGFFNKKTGEIIDKECHRRDFSHRIR